MVDVHGLASLPHRQDSIDTVVDITECPRLASVALNLDPILATGDSGAHFLDQLGDDVFPSHVRTIDVVRPEHLHLRQLVPRSEEHTSELQSLLRISYAVFCLKKKKKK